MTTIDIAGRPVDRLGFGAMRLTGLDDAAATALLRRVVELGVRFIDTADIYGAGRSEALIAAALHPYDPSLVIATKAGFVPGILRPGERMLPRDARPERLRACCEDSLRRLRVDRIDLFQLHAPDPAVPIEDSIGELVRLRDEGKIAAIGVSNVGRRELEQARSLTDVASVQNRYNLADRSSQRVLDACTAAGIAFLPWGPVQQGESDAVTAIAAARGVGATAVALAWLLQRSPVMLPIPGTSQIRHLEHNVAARDIELSDDEIARLDALVA